jgi:hypothetical protein
MEHTKEPWEVKTVPNTDQTYFIQSKIGTIASVKNGYGWQQVEANALRIVACVNACAGYTNEDLDNMAKTGGLRMYSYQTVKAIADDSDRLAAENKRLRDALCQIAYGSWPHILPSDVVFNMAKKADEALKEVQ